MSTAVICAPVPRCASKPISTVVLGRSPVLVGSAPPAFVSVTVQLAPTGIPVMGALFSWVFPRSAVSFTVSSFTVLPSAVQRTWNSKVFPCAKFAPGPSSILVTTRLPSAMKPASMVVLLVSLASTTGSAAPVAGSAFESVAGSWALVPLVVNVRARRVSLLNVTTYPSVLEERRCGKE